jgi:hypothetical protein
MKKIVKKPSTYAKGYFDSTLNDFLSNLKLLSNLKPVNL